MDGTFTVTVMAHTARDAFDIATANPSALDWKPFDEPSIGDIVRVAEPATEQHYEILNGKLRLMQ